MKTMCLEISARISPGSIEIWSTDPEIVEQASKMIIDMVPRAFRYPGSKHTQIDGQQYRVSFDKLQDKDLEVGMKIAKSFLSQGWEPLNFDIGGASLYFKLVKTD